MIGPYRSKTWIADCAILGAFGNVRVGWVKSNKNSKYAIKTMKKAEIIKSKHVDHIENEKNILEKLQHPFVVRDSCFKKDLLIARFDIA